MMPKIYAYLPIRDQCNMIELKEIEVKEIRKGA